MLTNFKEYIGTESYYEGLIVELSGILIEITIIAFLVFQISKYLKNRKEKPITLSSKIFLFDVFNKLMDVYLEILGVDSVEDFYTKKINIKDKPSFNFIYGFLEVKFISFLKAQNRGLFYKKLQALTPEELNMFISKFEGVRREFESITLLTMTVPDFQHEIYALRGTFLAPENYLKKILAQINGNAQIYQEQMAYCDRSVSSLVETLLYFFNKYKVDVDNEAKRREVHHKKMKVMNQFKLIMEHQLISNGEDKDLRRKVADEFVPSLSPEKVGTFRFIVEFYIHHGPQLIDGFMTPTPEVYNTTLQILKKIETEAIDHDENLLIKLIKEMSEKKLIIRQEERWLIDSEFDLFLKEFLEHIDNEIGIEGRQASVLF